MTALSEYTLPELEQLPAKKRPYYQRYLTSEARALRTRLKQVRPFPFTMPMVGAANIPVAAHRGINELLKENVFTLDRKILRFIRKTKKEDRTSPAKLQKEYALLKLRFNSLLDQLDIFADVLTQRGEHHTGVWLAGLDRLAEDALSIKGNFYENPPVICYLDRGHGAAIRRARTRLPGGHSNPVAVIRVPRERMVSTGIAASLIHEVGHQGSALLKLVPSLRPILRQKARNAGYKEAIWNLYERWLSEILSDFWAMAHLGIGATMGLMGVVSLPEYFVFRMNLDDPHPFSYIRVKISCAFGRYLFPHAQWDRLENLWSRYYPTRKLPRKKRLLLLGLEEELPAFVRLIAHHRPPSLRGRSLYEVLPIRERQPSRLRHLYENWKLDPAQMNRAQPSLVFAGLGQARADQKLSPSRESLILRRLLRRWAMKKLITKR